MLFITVWPRSTVFKEVEFVSDSMCIIIESLILEIYIHVSGSCITYMLTMRKRGIFKKSY